MLGFGPRSPGPRPQDGAVATYASRRRFLHRAALGSAGLGLGLDGPAGARAQSPPLAANGPAKHVIFLYLHGGAPTQDMYDLKPQAPIEVRGEFNPIDTNVPGIQICEHLPRLARWMDRTVVIRSMQHRAGCHNEIPSYTGYDDPRGPEMAAENLPPSMGSVCEYLKPESDRLPAYVYLPNPLGYVGESGPGGGFLGRRYDPLWTKCPPETDPGVPTGDRANPPEIRGVPRLRDTDLAQGLTLADVAARRALLSGLAQGGAQAADSASDSYSQLRSRAFDLLTAPELAGCFAPEKIDDQIRARYGNTLFGNSAYVATQLIAAGVRFVNVTWTWYYQAVSGLLDYGWDTHEHNFSILRRYLPQLDLACSALLEDLAASGKLDETLIVLTSDFGRTPGVNRTAGRDHWTFCYGTLLAGAGVRGGQLYGASDHQAAWPVDRPVHPADLCATIYRAMGLDPDALIYDRANRPHRLAQGGEPLWDVLA